MHVTGHALAGWNVPAEHVVQRMAAFVLRNRRIVGLRFSEMAMLRINAGRNRVTVVGIYHVASATA